MVDAGTSTNDGKEEERRARTCQVSQDKSLKRKRRARTLHRTKKSEEGLEQAIKAGVVERAADQRQ